MEEKDFKVALFSVFKRAIEEKRKKEFAGGTNGDEEAVNYVSIGGDVDIESRKKELIEGSLFKDAPPKRWISIDSIPDIEPTLRVFAMSIPDKVNRLCQVRVACDKVRNSVEKVSDEYGSFYMGVLKEALNGAIEYNKARLSDNWSTEASSFRECLGGEENAISPYMSQILPLNGDYLSEENAKTPTLGAYVKFANGCETRRKSVLDSIWADWGVTESEFKAGIEAVANALIRHIDNPKDDDIVEKLFSEFEGNYGDNRAVNIADITETLIEYAGENGVDVSRIPSSFEGYDEKQVSSYLFLVVEKIIKKEMASLMKCDYLKQTVEGTSNAANRISETVSSLYQMLGNTPVAILEEIASILNKSGKGKKPSWVQHINTDDRYGVIFESVDESALKSATGKGRKKKVQSQVPCPLRGHSLSIPLTVGYFNPDETTGTEQVEEEPIENNEVKLDNEVLERLFSEIIGDTEIEKPTKRKVEEKNVSIFVDGWTTNDGVFRTINVQVPGYFTGDENIIDELHGVFPMYYKCLDPVVVLACIMEVILDEQCDFYRNNQKAFERLRDVFGDSIIA